MKRSTKSRRKIKVLDEESTNTLNGVGRPNSELEDYPHAKVMLFYETDSRHIGFFEADT